MSKITIARIREGLRDLVQLSQRAERFWLELVVRVADFDYRCASRRAAAARERAAAQTTRAVIASEDFERAGDALQAFELRLAGVKPEAPVTGADEILKNMSSADVTAIVNGGRAEMEKLAKTLADAERARVTLDANEYGSEPKKGEKK